MIAKEYYWRLLKTAAKNTSLRTGLGISILLYGGIGVLSGAIFFVNQFGWHRLLEQWQEFLAFVVVGGAGSWCVAFVISGVAAPFQMHVEDEESWSNRIKTITDSIKAIGDERNDLRQALKVQNSKEDALDFIGQRMKAGHELFEDRTGDLRGWSGRVTQWHLETVAGIEKYLRPADAQFFDSIAGRESVSPAHVQNNEHRQQLTNLKHWCDNLQELYRREAGT